ncbi:MAG: RdgB/HAM1 family non-canonical purine NTP pyrophosphatase [Bacteroidota bacterium]|nr:RdgB/HAM1 family non-canonical purine NTP pyrophosphatase [Bacteroidota bacterium]
MKTQLIFATNNEHKIAEIRSVIGNDFSIITLQEAGITIDIPEPHETLEANASEKSRTIYQMTNQHCFSEDTGLEVTSLKGAPGVKSARYAGEGRDFQQNIDLLLKNLEGKSDRTARFRTVISLILDGREILFEGICEGRIATDQKGLQGFGYDPVFIPDGATKRFAEMTMDEKNKYSHRKKAVDKLIQYLQTKDL